MSLLGERRDLLWAQLTLLRDRFEPVSIGTINAVRWLGHDPLAVAIAREKGSEDDYASTLEPLDWRTREETAAVRALVQTWQRPAAIIRALDVMGRDLLKRHGEHLESGTVYRLLLEASERCGSIPGQAEALLQIAIIQAAQGEFGLAQETARRAQGAILHLGPWHELRFGTMALASILAFFLEGNWEELATEVAGFAASLEAARNPRGLVAGAYAALGYVRAGNEADARRLLTALTPALERMEPTMYVHHAAITFGGSAVWEIGAAELAPAYRRLALQLVAAGFCDGILLHEATVARMAALVGQTQEAWDYFARARDRCDANGLRLARAIMDYDEAVARVRAGSSDNAEILAQVDASLMAFRALDMNGWAERALVLKQKLAAPNPSASSIGRAHPDGLTAREIDVLRLLAAGKTNNEIAKALVLSVRTVERHISNIYGKIGAHSRVQATTYALSSGSQGTGNRDQGTGDGGRD